MSRHAGWHGGLPVDGADRPTSEGRTFTVRNPADGAPMWEVPDAGVAEVDVAVRAAWRAFHATQWSSDPAMRSEVIGRLQDALVDRSDELARLLAAETGVPIALRAAHLDAAIAGLRADHRPGPPGVTAVITPATSPLAVAIEEVGRVLAAGGTIVLKPAPEAASAALEVGRIALDILPRGVLNVVSTRDVDVATALTIDDRVDEISLTGSAVTGERVRVAGERAGTRVRLDLGGPAPLHAPDDGDLAAAVAAAAGALAANAGQGCRLPASVVVPPHRYAEALQAAVAAMAEVVVGDPAEPDTLCGPLRSMVARSRVLRYLDLARAEGGTVEVGGHALDRASWWIAPTVIGGLDRRSRLVREEVLGPVLMVVADARPDASARA